MEDSTGVFFETGNARPTGAGEHILEILGSELGRLPNKVRIEGHTDARPYRDPNGYGNWELSADRANVARRILTANGLADRQVSEVRGLADRQLRVKDDPLAPANRRIAITVLLDSVAKRDSVARDSLSRGRSAT
jgi:chemotaxis protein MotB